MSASVEIFLIREKYCNKRNTSEDDRIVIKPIDRIPTVKYIDSLNDAKSYTLQLRECTLQHYIKILMKTLIYDEDPFWSVQFYFPGFPTILCTVEQITQKRALQKTILQMAELVYDHWMEEHPAEPIEAPRDTQTCYAELNSFVENFLQKDDTQKSLLQMTESIYNHIMKSDQEKHSTESDCTSQEKSTEYMATPPQSCRRHMFFDEDGHTISCGESVD